MAQEKGQKGKQWTTNTTLKTKDRVTRNPLRVLNITCKYQLSVPVPYVVLERCQLVYPKTFAKQIYIQSTEERITHPKYPRFLILTIIFFNLMPAKF